MLGNAKEGNTMTCNALVGRTVSRAGLEELQDAGAAQRVVGVRRLHLALLVELAAHLDAADVALHACIHEGLRRLDHLRVPYTHIHTQSTAFKLHIRVNSKQLPYQDTVR